MLIGRDHLSGYVYAWSGQMSERIDSSDPQRRRLNDIIILLPQREIR